MKSLLQNKYIRFGLALLSGLVIIAILIVVWAIVSASLKSTTFSGSNDIAPGYARSVSSGALSRDDGLAESMPMMDGADSYYLPTPAPNPVGYTTELETYETTSYTLSGRTTEFDSFCDTLHNLKADSAIHFKNFSRSLNNCSATMYAETAAAQRVRSELTSYTGITENEMITSVTRHRQQIQGRTQVLEQQLASVSQSLTMAETQFDELAMFARTQNDASALSEAIRYKLQNVDKLTDRKIGLIAQLDNLYQQAADLEERLGVVEFSVSVHRLHPIQVNETKVRWLQAWEDLKDQTTDTLIGLTTVFGIFILWMIRIAIYLLVVIVLIRGLWKFGNVVWKKW